MKYLLVLAVVVIAVFVWRNNRREHLRDARRQAGQRRAPGTPAPLAPPQAMARCHHCGMHLPAQEALAGRLGHYCSQAHRELDEG